MSDRMFNRVLHILFALSMVFIFIGLPMILSATGRVHYTF